MIGAAADASTRATNRSIAPMSNAATIAAAALVAGGVAFATAHLSAPTQSPAPADNNAGDLATEVATLRRQLDELRTAAVPATARATDATAPERREAVAVITDEQIQQALQRYLAEHGKELLPSTTGADDIDVDKSVASMRGSSSYWAHSDLYKRLFAAGKMDELIKAFEQSASASPNDTQAQLDLGNAYLAYLQLDQSKWPFAQKADAAFDRVLAIDENHWQARFTKALSYSFWPDFTGKKPAAIANFERLVEQQSKMPTRPEFAQTYFFLGNLLDQRGETARAKEIWQQGLRLFPDNAQLREKAGQ